MRDEWIDKKWINYNFSKKFYVSRRYHLEFVYSILIEFVAPFSNFYRSFRLRTLIILIVSSITSPTFVIIAWTFLN